jgi:ribonuclease HI/predicted kinase
MELQAALEAVRTLSGPLEVVSDSTYVVNCFRQRWWQGWLDRGWINSQKQPVANRDLWEPFIELVRRRGDVSFRWVKGHSGHTMNDFVDQLAVEAIRRRTGRALGVTPAVSSDVVVARASAHAGNEATRIPNEAVRALNHAVHSPNRAVRTPSEVTDVPTVYLVVGGTGAGKTTYAIALANAKRALRFSIDEWMKGLFSPDQTGLAFEWMMERVERCEAQIWNLARQALAIGTPVVLDLGFAVRQQRERFGGLALEQNAKVEVHFLEVAAEVRRERVRERNSKRDPSLFALEVTDEMFDFMEARFEPPSVAELRSGMLLVKAETA